MWVWLSSCILEGTLPFQAGWSQQEPAHNELCLFLTPIGVCPGDICTIKGCLTSQ